MITRLIAETLTPIVTKSRSRFLKLQGARGVISNHPYLELEAPTYHRCRTTLIMKQGANRLPFRFRAHMGFLHLDFKAHTPKQARRKCHSFFQLLCVGELTTWGYGRIQWILQKHYHNQKSPPAFRPRFRLLKGLPPNLSHPERQLVMAALLHDLVDTNVHASKLGPTIVISDPYVHWLCEHHHRAKEHPDHPGLQLLQAADIRQSRYARLLDLPTRRRKMAPVNTHQLARRLEETAHQSVHKLYSFIYNSQELNSLTASKRHSTETLRNHLIGAANWVLFLLRTRAVTSLPASAPLAGQPGATPGPVEMEDPRDTDEPSASW